MATIKNALDALQNGAARSRASKALKERVAHVSSSLILMKSSFLSSASKDALHALLRSPLVPLYIAFPEQALGLSLSVFKVISKDKILPSSNPDEKQYWEKVQHSILSGVMDYIEEHDNAESKNAVASIFYPTICSMFFPNSDSPQTSVRKIGVNLRASAYMTLYESAHIHADNQRKLRDPELLGGKRIGLVLSQTDDYLAIETLFTLIARILPSSNNSSNGPIARSKFIREIFLLPSFPSGNKMAEILDDISKTDWDETAAVLIDILAAENINFPQPFAIDEIRTCGATFPQPTSADRLYLDQTCFFGNISDEGEAYESLQVFYADVDSICLKPGPTTTGVSVKLRAPAILAESPMKHSGELSADFEIRNEDMERFLDTLTTRGLQKAISGRQRKFPRSSVPSLSITMTESAYKMSRQDQVEGLTRTYNLDGHDTVFSDSPNPETQIDPKALNGLPHWNTVSEAVLSTISEEAAIVPTQVKRSTVFGNSGDDLSDIEEIEFAMMKPKPAAAPKASGKTNLINAEMKVNVVESDDETDYLALKRNTRSRALPLKKIAFESQKEDDGCEIGRSLQQVHSDSSKKGVQQSGQENTPSLPSKPTAEVFARSAIFYGHSPHSNQVNLLSSESVIVLEDDPAPPPRSNVYPRSSSGPTISTKYERSGKIAHVAPQDVLSGPAEQPPGNASRGRVARMKDQHNQISQAQPDHSKEGRKRKAAVAVEPDPSTQASLKRHRGAGALDKPLIPASVTMTHLKTIEVEKSTKSVRRYGKKRKASSPPPNLPTGVNFDELPGSGISEAHPPKKGKNAARDATVINESRKTRASVTQHKNKRVDTPMTPIEKTKKRPLKARSQRAPKTNKAQEAHAASVTEKSKEALPLKAVDHQTLDIEMISLHDKEKLLTHMGKAGESAHEKVADGSTPGTRGEDGAALGEDNGRSHVDGDSIDYVLPAKNGSPLLKLPVIDTNPREDIAMVDFPQKSPVKQRETTTVADAILQPEKPTVDVFSPPSDPFQRLSSPNPRFRRSVTFAASTVHTAPSSLNDEDDNFHPLNISKNGRLVRKYTNTNQEYPLASAKQLKFPHRDSELQAIMEILQEIQMAIARNISKKVEGVKREVRIGRDHLFRQTASDMAEMRSESDHHFDILVELEQDYATYRRKNIQSWEDIRRTNRDICGLIDQTIEDHDRSVSSRKLPKSVFTKPLPAILMSIQPKRKK